MKSILISIFLFFPVLLFSQIYTVFKVTNNDTLNYKGNVLTLPGNVEIDECSYLIEFDGEYLIKSVELDKTAPGIKVFGYIYPNSRFDLILETDDQNQIFELNKCVRYLLIRTGGNQWQSVNINFILE